MSSNCKMKNKLVVYARQATIADHIRRPTYVEMLCLRKISSLERSRLKRLKYLKYVLVQTPGDIQKIVIEVLSKFFHKILRVIKSRPAIISNKLIRNFHAWETFSFISSDAHGWKNLLFLKKLQNLTVDSTKRAKKLQLPSKYLSRASHTLLGNPKLKLIHIKGLYSSELLRILNTLNESLETNKNQDLSIILNILDGNQRNLVKNVHLTNLFQKTKEYSLRMEGSVRLLKQISIDPNLFSKLETLSVDILNFHSTEMSYFEGISNIQSLKTYSFAANSIPCSVSMLERFFQYFFLPKQVEKVILSLLFIDWTIILPKTLESLQENEIFEGNRIMDHFFSRWESLINLTSLTVFLNISSVKSKANFAKKFAHNILKSNQKLTTLSFHFDAYIVQQDQQDIMNSPFQYDPYKNEEDILRYIDVLRNISNLGQSLKKFTLNYPLITLENINEKESLPPFKLEEFNIIGLCLEPAEILHLDSLIQRKSSIYIADIWLIEDEGQDELLEFLSPDKHGTLSIVAMSMIGEDVVRGLTKFVKRGKRPLSFSIEYQINKIKTLALKALGEALVEHGTFERVEIKSGNKTFLYLRTKRDYIIKEPEDDILIHNTVELEDDSEDFYGEEISDLGSHSFLNYYQEGEGDEEINEE